VTALPYARLSAFYFAYYAAMGAFVPYWSLYLDARGIAPGAIGVLMGLWYATRVFAPSLWGLGVARASRPVRWLQAGCVATALAFLVFLAPLPVPGIALVMLVFCALFNAVMPQFESLTLSHLSERSERYGGIRVWGSVGFIVVVVALGRLLDHRPPGELPYWMAPLFLLLACASFGIDYGRPPAREAPEPDFWPLVFRREVIVFLLLAFLMQVSFGPYYTYFSLFLQQNGYQPSMLGVFWALGVIIEIVVFAYSARLLNWIPARRMILIALALAAVRWLVTALLPTSLPMMVLAQLTHAITFGGFFAACMKLMSEYFPGRSGGHGQGLFYGFSSGLGGVAGALLASGAWQLSGGRLAFILAAVAALVGVRLAYWEFGAELRALASAPQRPDS